MYHIQKPSLVACILLVLLYVGCGGGGGGTSNPSPPGTNTFIVTDPNTGIQLLCQTQNQGGGTLTGCASAGASMNSSDVISLANEIPTAVNEVIACAQNIGYDLTAVVEQTQELMGNDIESMELQSLVLVVATSQEIPLLCRLSDAVGCFAPINIITGETVDTGTIFVPDDSTDRIADFKHELGHLLEEFLLGCETHLRGSIAENCGKCDCQYGTFKGLTEECGPSNPTALNILVNIFNITDDRICQPFIIPCT